MDLKNSFFSIVYLVYSVRVGENYCTDLITPYALKYFYTPYALKYFYSIFTRTNVGSKSLFDLFHCLPAKDIHLRYLSCKFPKKNFSEFYR